MILGTRAVATPLAFGNTVVLKASEVCPRTHAAIAAALHDAGLPDGAVNLVTHEPDAAADVVDELIAHPAVRRINFTGSTRVGAGLIAENAARHLKRVLLELGGKAPLVVLADADLDEPWLPPSSARSCTRARSACPPSASWPTPPWPTGSPPSWRPRPPS